MSASTAPSARRLAANRANASKSTGPRTEAGKRISSQNARKTPPCPFTFQLPAKFVAEWFHDALRRTAGCSDTRARLLLINRCMLQAHEIRWSALERTLFDVALDESGGCVEDASLWLAQQIAAAKGLATYHRWIAHRINLVERSLSALAAQSAGVEAEAPKTMAAGAGAGSAFSELSPSDLGPESTLPISYSDNGWSFGGLTGLFTYRVGAPQPPQPPKPPKPPTIGPIRGRYRLYLRCPAAPARPDKATATSADVPGRQRTHQSAEPQQVELHHQSACLPQQRELPGESFSQPPQPSPLPQHSHRHCRWPVAETTTPESNPTQSQASLRPQHTQADQPQCPTDGKADTLRVDNQATLPLEPHRPIPSQQPEPLPQHSHRHCRWPVAATTTSEPNPTQSASEPWSQDAHAHQSQATTEGNAVTIFVASPASFPREGRASKPSQQPKPLPQHSHRQCRWPAPATTAPEPNPRQLRQTASLVNDDTLRRTASPSLISSNRTQTRTSAAGTCPCPPSQPANSRPGAFQPIQPTLTPPPAETTHSPPVKAT